MKAPTAPRFVLLTLAIPSCVTGIGRHAFYSATNLSGVYFHGDAPIFGAGAFDGDIHTTVYHLPGTSGWEMTYGGRPTVLWVLPYPVILGTGVRFGVQPEGFGFSVSWATNATVEVEACEDLAGAPWVPLQTGTLANGTFDFIDPDWPNHPCRFYRICSP